jgi:predicted nucleic acid-binding protein
LCQEVARNSRLEIFSVDEQILRNAEVSGMPDFEDAVQAAAAEIAEIDYIATRNKRDFRHSPVPAISPDELLEKMQ